MDGLMPLDGKLSKYTNVVKGWQNRYFILNPQQGLIEYHISKSEAFGSHYKPRGSLALAGAVIAPSTEDSFTFSVNATNGEVYKLRASNTKERQEWVSRLRAVAHHFSSQIAEEHPPLNAGMGLRKPRSRSLMSNLNNNLNKVKDQMQQFSTPSGIGTNSMKVKQGNQTDSSLLTQSMVSKNNNLSRVRTDSRGSSGKAAKNPPGNRRRSLQFSDVPQLQEVHEVIVSADNYQAGLVSMLENLPYQGSNQHSSDALSNHSQEEQKSLSALDKDVLLIKSTSGAMLQSLNECYSILQRFHLHNTSALPPDAEISWVVPKSGYQQSGLPGSENGVSTQAIATFETPTLANPKDEVEDGEIAQEEDLGAVDEQKNVIMHLLSQLKIGMDLTKVTLPTFILEKRSLLEMYADFAGHPDIFVSLSDGDTPTERMHRVLKFYLSSFHSGRQGQIAKKPYNPIVGEVFQCSYYVPKDDAEPQDTGALSTDTQHRVRFISEQVSHHPPVSAFHVSCPDKNISLNSHIWTKAKFKNMSVGVINIGEGILLLSDHNESYVITYPSAYARSILTVPWTELGGRCSITCEKTGLTSSVVFHTKPMYGGQPHRVTAEVKNNSGFVSCRVEGKWNEELEFTYYQDEEDNNGSNSGTGTRVSTEMIDSSTLTKYHKWVRPLHLQSLMESRKLWKNVTESLRKEDIVSATQHKTNLENQQREIEKQRQEAQLPVPTTYFTKCKGKEYDTYTYNDSLSV